MAGSAIFMEDPIKGVRKELKVAIISAETFSLRSSIDHQQLFVVKKNGIHMGASAGNRKADIAGRKSFPLKGPSTLLAAAVRSDHPDTGGITAQFPILPIHVRRGFVFV
jgi:hypothetical protein